MLDAVHQAKQVAWAASRSRYDDDLRALVAYLIEQSGVLMEAEARIDGRAPGIASPSTHQRDNLMAEWDNDVEAAVATLANRLTALVTDVRSRSALIAATAEAQLLTRVASGIHEHVERLRSS